MTKPRTSSTRELFGILGAHPEASKLQKEWNAYFAANEMDAFMDRYPTTEKQLPERLSEMFHFDRRAYIVGLRLQKAIISLLDSVDSSVEDRVNVVVNRGGEFWGYFADTSVESVIELIHSAVENEELGIMN